jgi:hypothetical protein
MNAVEDRRWRVAVALFVALFTGLGLTITSQAVEIASEGDQGPAGVCVQAYAVPDDPFTGQIITGVTAPTRDASGVMVCETGTFVPVDSP